VIVGRRLADDYGAGVFLNGVSVGQSALPAFSGESGPMEVFALNGAYPGGASFNVGQNILTFAVLSDATNHGTINDSSNTPTGLRGVFTQADSAPTVPEPSTFALVGSGIGAAVLRALKSPSNF